MRVRRNKLIIIFSLVSSFICIKEGHAAVLCNVLLSPPHEINAHGESDLDETGYFIAYLNELFDEKIITEDQLSHFILGLKRGEVLNPLRDKDGSASEIQGEGIQEYINKVSLDPHRLLEWAEQRLREKKRVQIRRSETQEETFKLYQKMVFHPVRVGSFEMGDVKKVNVQLTHAIEVMSTPVTQAQWVEIMGENPSGYSDGEHSIVIRRNGKTIQMQPHHPVENVTWWSALVFANRLSVKHGFQPAYDLNGIAWVRGTEAEKGSLGMRKGVLRLNTPNGSRERDEKNVYYQTEGYRLPTEAEQEYLLRAGGTTNLYHFGNNAAQLKDYAWFIANSDDRTHPVAELKPLILDGNAFYDLHGNVQEWGWDQYSPQTIAGVDPVGSYGVRRVIRGGGFKAEAPYQRSGYRDLDFPNALRPWTGFRLVRTIGVPGDESGKK